MQLKGLPLIFCVLTFISSWFSITVVGQEVGDPLHFQLAMAGIHFCQRVVTPQVPALPAASDGSQRTQIPVGGESMLIQGRFLSATCLQQHALMASIHAGARVSLDHLGPAIGAPPLTAGASRCAPACHVHDTHSPCSLPCLHPHPR